MSAPGRISRLLTATTAITFRPKLLLTALWLGALFLLSQQHGVPGAEAHEIIEATLTVQHSGKCLTVEGASQQNGAKVIQWTCNGGLNQQVEITDVSSGWHQIKFKHSGKCLDVPYGDPNPGIQLEQYTCNGQTNQRFNAPSGSGYISAIQGYNGLCLDVAWGSTENGAAVIQWNCNGQSNQRWKLALPDCPWYPNWYSAQHEEGVATFGQFGWFYTYQPYVPTTSGAFSLSTMLTKACSECDTWVEVGWIKSPSQGLTTATYYSGLKTHGVPQMTFNYYETAAPSRYVAYEIQFEGYSLRSETDRWGAYIDNLSSPRIVYDVPDMRAGWPTSMGEAKVVSGTQIRTRATPNHQLKDESGVWHNWTPAYAPGTHGCTDPNFRWIWYRRYDDFYADGTVP